MTAASARRSSGPAPRTGRERGVVLVMVAVLILVLIGFAALVIDLGKLFKVRNELQNASDSAALAGAGALDRTAAGVDLARERALDYAALHEADQGEVVVVDDDVVFGTWDEDTRTFTPLGSAPDEPAAVDAVRVTTRREDATGDPVTLHLGPVLGTSRADVRTDAIAVAGGPRSECGFPMVVADCALDQALDDGSCGHCMTYQDSTSDNAGWTSFDDGSVSGPTITELIRAACFDRNGHVAVDPVTGECQGACEEAELDQEIKVQNGNLLNQGKNNFCPVLQTILTRGIKNGPARAFTVRVPVLASTPGSSCDASRFSSYHTIAGFAAFDILGARCGNADPGVFVAGASCTPPASGKYVIGALRCDLVSEDPAGGGWFGIRTLHPRLVE